MGCFFNGMFYFGFKESGAGVEVLYSIKGQLKSKIAPLKSPSPAINYSGESWTILDWTRHLPPPPTTSSHVVSNNSPTLNPVYELQYKIHICMHSIASSSDKEWAWCTGGAAASKLLRTVSCKNFYIFYSLSISLLFQRLPFTFNWVFFTSSQPDAQFFVILKGTVAWDFLVWFFFMNH